MNKKRIIIVSSIMAGIVLILLLAVIGVASTNKNQKTTEEVAIDATAQTQTEEKKDPSSENLAPVSNSEASGSVQSDVDDTPTVKGEIISDNSYSDPLPATGPTDILPLILLAGMLTTYVTSKVYLAFSSQKEML